MIFVVFHSKAFRGFPIIFCQFSVIFESFYYLRGTDGGISHFAIFSQTNRTLAELLPIHDFQVTKVLCNIPCSFCVQSNLALEKERNEEMDALRSDSCTIQFV